MCFSPLWFLVDFLLSLLSCFGLKIFYFAVNVNHVNWSAWLSSRINSLFVFCFFFSLIGLVRGFSPDSRERTFNRGALMKKAGTAGCCFLHFIYKGHLWWRFPKTMSTIHISADNTPVLCSTLSWVETREQKLTVMTLPSPLFFLQSNWHEL